MNDTYPGQMCANCLFFSEACGGHCGNIHPKSVKADSGEDCINWYPKQGRHPRIKTAPRHSGTSRFIKPEQYKGWLSGRDRDIRMATKTPEKGVWNINGSLCDDKMARAFKKIVELVEPYGFIALLTAFEPYYESSFIAAQVDLHFMNEERTMECYIPLQQDVPNGPVSVCQFLNNGDIVDYDAKPTFFQAAKYAIDLFKNGSFKIEPIEYFNANAK